MTKHTLESIQDLSNKKHNNNYIVVSGQTYINNKSKLKFYCKTCENIIEQRVDNHLHGTKCYICSNKESFLTINDIKKKVKEIFGDKYFIPEQEINGTKHKIRVFCNVCKKYFTIKLNNILQGYGCRYCKYNKIRLTLEDVRKRSFKIHGNKYFIPEQEIKNNDSRIEVFCKKCNNSYSVLLHSFLQGYGCKKCAIKSRTHTIQDIQEISKKIHGDLYLIEDQIIDGVKTTIKIWCKKCNKYFNQRVGDHIVGCGCSICNSSKGEKIIRQYLLDSNIKFDSQKRFKECRSKLPLPFDFYLPELNICIEYDGEQHFKENRHFGGKEYLEKTKYHDQIKNEYCKNNNIKLIRIKYCDNIKEKLLGIIPKN